MVNKVIKHGLLTHSLVFQSLLVYSSQFQSPQNCLPFQAEVPGADPPSLSPSIFPHVHTQRQVLDCPIKKGRYQL